ncbi:lysophospholipid acyltransferase family protein [Streptomyces sp. NPDC048604]|uniref:lysophospholipid acyltransferase family protein n=1 Tax=Streptomyces sp. NPDC048604 TaxID=3365578 RepID=UPI003712C08D
MPVRPAPAVSPWLPTAPCTPGGCTAHPGPGAPVAGPVLAAVRLAAGLAAVLLGVVCSPLASALPATARAALVRLWALTVLRAFGVRPVVRGGPAPGDRPQLVVANHVSWLDIALIAAVLPGRMLAKKEIRDWPVLGPLIARGGTLFLDRDGLRALPGTVRQIAGTLSGGARVVVFPEGSTWCGRAQGRFRPAAFQAALDAGADVQPVRLVYTPHGPAAFVADDSLIDSLRRIVRARALTAELTVLPPIPAHAHPDRRALARAAQQAVTGHLTAPDAVVPAQRGPAGAPGHRAPASGPGQRASASDRANRPFRSVHHCESSSPASASSARTPS